MVFHSEELINVNCREIFDGDIKEGGGKLTISLKDWNCLVVLTRIYFQVEPCFFKIQFPLYLS